MLAVFAWTREHIRPTPAELPVIDDHTWHIIIRGYGEDDQMADVFATLSTYAGVPAFCQVIRPADGGRLILSFANVHGRWAMLDVAHGLVFRDAQKHLRDAREILAHPELIESEVQQVAPRGRPYVAYLNTLAPFDVPPMLRAQLQMPLPRLVYEARRRLRLVDDAAAWDIRSQTPKAFER